MDHQTYLDLEAAAFAAWPALAPDEMFMGWRLRYSGGTTKRINSANSTVEAADLTPDQIDQVEQRYRQRGLPAIFRMTSVATPPHIDAALEARGYRQVDPTWVMTLPMQNFAGSGSSLRALDVDEWLDCYRHITQADGSALSTNMKMIRAGNDGCVFAVEYLEGVPRSCGIGVISSEQIGLFAVATDPAHQRKGLANRLCAKLLDWGREQGATGAYLQVVQSNVRAMRMYENLGFKPAYHYWYRVLP